MQTRTLLFDGAIGTYLQAEYGVDLADIEETNLTDPALVVEMHRQYIEAGAEAIQTNTYAANTHRLRKRLEHILRIIDAACDNATQAASRSGARVYACMGPIPGDPRHAFLEYRALMDRFLANGISSFLFQSFAAPEEFVPLAQYIKRKHPSAYVICQGTVSPDGYSVAGATAQRFADVAADCPEIDAAGFNCTCGPTHLGKIMRAVDWHGKPTAAMPNAGFPTTEGGRTVYSEDPQYFARQLVSLVSSGIPIVGGCCGTTPAHIAQAARLLREGVEGIPKRPAAAPRVHQQASRQAEPPRKHPFIAVELDPPADVAKGEKFFTDAEKIAAAGADLVTIADCPVGRARGDSSVLATLLRQQHGIAVLPHLTCRDRNLNASKALLLALHMAAVENVLLVTGDPLPVEERERTKGVFQFNSASFACLVRSLNETVFQARPFRIMGALNVNAKSFQAELDKAKRKKDSGMTTFLSQPVMDARARDNLHQAREALELPVLAGVMPVLSYRNACFINNEMGGISIPRTMVESYEGKSKEDCARMAVDYALQQAEAARKVADGFYIITMLGRADISSALTKEILQWSL